MATAVTASHRCGRFRLWKAREPSSCQNGIRLKRLIQAPTRARAPQSGYSVSRYDPGADQGRGAAPDRPGQADAGIFAGVDERLPEPDHGPEPRDEQRRGGGDAVSHQGGHVAHLVDVDRQDETQANGAPKTVQ